MNSTMKRVLTSIIAPTALFSLIIFLPHASYLALSVLAILVALGGAHELRGLAQSALGSSIKLPIILPALLPVAQWLQINYFPTIELTYDVFIVLTLAVVTAELFIGKKDSYEHSLIRMASGVFILFYPGLLITFIQRITVFENATALLILFFLIIFGNDIFAYVFGMTLGKNNRGWASVSPNKSIAGLIGGILAAIIIGGAFAYFIPSLQKTLSLTNTLIISGVVAIAANIGDLVESAFKRSAKMKDSGSLIPGRGGLLDSIDSMLFAGPIFTLLLAILAV
ncbi:MAG: phosphatidate cytidylyltransferase [Sphaerochaeta sp.]